MIPGRYPALLDANVLHPAFLRGALLWFATERLFRPCWTTQILDEWRGSLLRRFPDDEGIAGKIDRQRSTMLEQFPEAMIEGHEFLIESLKLPDPNDRHVLAAAIVGRCNGIITCNTRHFPEEVVAPFGIEVVHPDNFIVNIIDLDPTKALTACLSHRKALTTSLPSADEFLEQYRAKGLIQAHTRLLKHRELI